MYPVVFRVSAGWVAAVLGVAAGLNFVWEMAQAPLYEPMGSGWEATRRCIVASVGDAVLVLLVLAAIRVLSDGASVERQYAAAAVCGVLIAIAVEFWGLNEGRWAYVPRMPRVPATSLGVVPLLQLTVLTPVTMWLGNRISRQRG